MKPCFLFFSNNDAENKIENGAKCGIFNDVKEEVLQSHLDILTDYSLRAQLSNLLIQSFISKLESCVFKMNAKDF